MVFLSETRLFGRRAANLRRRLGFDGVIYVDCVGRSGGLTLLWRNTWQVHLRSSSRSHIDVDVISDLGDAWQFTGFYGPIKKKSSASCIGDAEAFAHKPRCAMDLWW